MKYLKLYITKTSWVLNISLISFILITLNGCAGLKNETSYVHDRRSDYLTSQEGQKELEIPDGLNKSQILHSNDIPEIKAPSERLTPKLAKPPGSLAAYHAQHSELDQIVLQDPIPVSAIHILNKNGSLVMQLEKPIDRAWVFVASALQRQGVRVVGRDETTKNFRIASDTGETKTTIVKNRVIKQKESVLYQIQLRTQTSLPTASPTETTEIVVLDETGQPAKTKVARDVLTRLSKGLRGKSRSTLAKLITTVMG